MVRQVLQHLTNSEIIKFVEKVKSSYEYLICTEHLPSNNDYIPNIDKPTGADIRLGIGSGIDLTRAPFNLAPFVIIWIRVWFLL